MSSAKVFKNVNSTIKNKLPNQATLLKAKIRNFCVVKNAVKNTLKEEMSEKLYKRR